MRPYLLLLLAACAPVDATQAPGSDASDAADDTDAAVADTDAAALQACTAEVAWISPDDGTAHVPIETPIQAAFDPALPARGTWSLTVSGTDGVATLSADRRVATFKPADPLAPDARYTVEATACGGPPVASTFRTLGPPVDLSRLAGRTWSVDLAALSWVAPASSSAVLPLFDMPAVLVHVRAEPDGLHLEGRFAASLDGHVLPIPCARPFDLGRMDLAGNPRFTTDGAGFGFDWQSERVVAEDVHVEGVLDDGGDTLDSLAFRGLIDVRPIEGITGIRDLCAQATSFGEACAPCGDGVVACLPTLVTDGAATEVAPGDFDLDPLDILGLCP